MTGQQSRPGGRSQAANVADTRVGADSPPVFEWLAGVAAAGPRRAILRGAVELAEIAAYLPTVLAITAPDLARRTGLAVSTVEKVLGGLVRNGWLVRVRQAVAWPGYTDPGRYRLAIGAPIWQGYGRRGRDQGRP